RRQGNGAPSKNVERQLNEEMASLTLGRLVEFRKDVDVQIAAFRDALTGFKKERMKVAGYGAPARLSTICNYGRIGPDLIEFTVDDSPLKQDKFSPGTHIP